MKDNERIDPIALWIILVLLAAACGLNPLKHSVLIIIGFMVFLFRR